MTTTTTLEWTAPGESLPDHQELVLLYCPQCDEPLGMGHWDASDDRWLSSEGENLNALVEAWARPVPPEMVA